MITPSITPPIAMKMNILVETICEWDMYVKTATRTSQVTTKIAFRPLLFMLSHRVAGGVGGDSLGKP